MRKLTIACALALAAALLPSLALAQIESTPIPLPSRPDFSSMRFMLGTWTCAVKSARRPAAYIVTSTYTMNPNGWYIDETSTTTPTKWFSSQNRLTAYDKITWDSTTHRWVDVLYDNQGGYGLSFSKGWMLSTITWHDVSFAPTDDVSSQTDVVTMKMGPGKMVSHSSFTETRTGRRVMVVTTCTKT
jgi:hypothetical protein